MNLDQLIPPWVLHLSWKRTSGDQWNGVFKSPMFFLSPNHLWQNTWSKHKALARTSGLASSFLCPPLGSCQKGTAPFTATLLCIWEPVPVLKRVIYCSNCASYSNIFFFLHQRWHGLSSQSQCHLKLLYTLRRMWGSVPNASHICLLPSVFL